MFDLWIIGFTELLPEALRAGARLNFESAVNSFIQSQFGIAKVTTTALSQKFESIFTATSQFARVSDFPEHSVNNYWRNFHFDAPPRAQALAIVNTKITLTQPSADGVIFVADLYTTSAPPSLPPDGCSLEDSGLSEAAIL